MPDEKIPCPVEGCDEVFADEAEAMAHMKEKHRDDFAPPQEQIIPPEEPPADQVQTVEKEKVKPDALTMVPPGLMAAMENKMDERIEAALESYLPQVQEAVAGAMQNIIAAQAQAAGLAMNPATGLPEGGVVTGSPVTPMGAAIINWMTRGSGGGVGDLENFIRQANQFKAIGELFNPPASLTERIMQTAYIRSLKNVGLVTDKQMSDVEKSLLGDVE